MKTDVQKERPLRSSPLADRTGYDQERWKAILAYLEHQERRDTLGLRSQQFFIRENREPVQLYLQILTE